MSDDLTKKSDVDEGDDYLWDRTGPADPGIEALETLLSGLRARPGTLRLPDRADSPLASQSVLEVSAHAPPSEVPTSGVDTGAPVLEVSAHAPPSGVPASGMDTGAYVPAIDPAGRGFRERWSSTALYAVAALILLSLGGLLWQQTGPSEQVVSIARVPTQTPVTEGGDALSPEEKLAGEQARAQVMAALNIASSRLNYARDAVNSAR